MADQPAPHSSEQPFHSLYRRFRPQKFSEVRGQDHVVRALRTAVQEDRVAHAYLFSGPRGTGKTSTARILAMALNCENPVNGEPDGTCPSCVDIRRGASVDVQELDAASNRRIDEMRDLLSRVALGTRGRWKVYIIDEVHQLTADAASALLKTLEEPPAHVVFVLATTDPQKVLPTIKSRTLHFEFHLLPSDVLGGLLRDVNHQAGLGVAPEAIDLVVRRGHGSARDALTVLDQVTASAGQVEDEGTVVAEVVDGLADRDAGRVLVAVAEAMSSGRDARRLAADILDHLRNGFLATMARGLVLLPDDAVTQVEEQARRLGTPALVRAMEGIGEALADMRDSVDPRVTLEVALVRLAKPEADTSVAALLERIERLERGAARGGPVNERGGAAAAPPRAAPAAPPAAPSAARPPASGGPPPPVPGAARSAGQPAAPPTGPAQPGRPASASRPALGAVRGSRVGPPPPVPGAPVQSPSPGAPSASPGAVPPGAPVPPERAPAPPGRAPAPKSQPAADRPMPTRDELTKAWGDGVLRGLSGRAKAYLGTGRFVEVDAEGAVYAVPDKHLLARAQDTRGEAEAALAARFGRPVRLRLILDGAARPVQHDEPGPEPEPETPDDFTMYDVGELQDAPPGVTSPEQRLLEAFPGAEEVSP
jgi:DNA polymerase-3 subunit gamma/tau